MQNLVEPNKWFADAVDARQASLLFWSQLELKFCVPIETGI